MGPNSVTHGVPNNAARCLGPVSLPTKIFAFLMDSKVCGNRSLQITLLSGISLAMALSIVCSAGAPMRVIGS